MSLKVGDKVRLIDVNKDGAFIPDSIANIWKLGEVYTIKELRHGHFVIDELADFKNYAIGFGLKAERFIDATIPWTHPNTGKVQIQISKVRNEPEVTSIPVKPKIDWFAINRASVGGQ